MEVNLPISTKTKILDGVPKKCVPASSIHIFIIFISPGNNSKDSVSITFYLSTLVDVREYRQKTSPPMSGKLL